MKLRKLAEAKLPLKIESLNKFKDSAFTVYSKKSRRKVRINPVYTKYKDNCKKAILLLGAPPKIEGKVLFLIESIRKRRLDIDNLVGGCKPLIDAMKEKGWCVDDSPSHIEHPDISQRIRVKGEEEGTLVVVYESCPEE